MIVGIGTDIIEIRRISRAIESSNNFLKRIFNDEELEYLMSRNLRPEYIAGRFAAKEAISKALGTGFRGFGFKDIIIGSNKIGKPIVELKERAKAIAAQHGDYNIFLSISHGEESAVATAILEVYGFEDRNCRNIK